MLSSVHFTFLFVAQVAQFELAEAQVGPALDRARSGTGPLFRMS
jgi:hypothetical protein